MSEIGTRWPLRRPRPAVRPPWPIPASALALLLLASAASGSLPAQDPPGGFGPPAPSASPRPRLDVPELEREFGEVLQGTPVTHSFVVRNRGEAPLRILKVHSNCGCTSTFFTAEIAPGEEGRVDLRIDTAELPGGYQRKNATVLTDDPAAGQVTLWLKGTVVPLLIAPDPVLRVAGICEESKEAVLRFLPGTDRPTEILGARLREERLTVVEVVPVEGGGADIRLGAGPGEAPGLQRDELLITVRLGEDEPVVTAHPIILEHEDRVRITPGGNIVFFRRQTSHLEDDPSRDVSREIHVRAARDDLPCRVTGARVEGAPEGLFHVEVREETPDRHYVVRLRVLKTLEESQAQAKLVIETDDPIRPFREIDVYAQFRLRTPRG